MKTLVKIALGALLGSVLGIGFGLARPALDPIVGTTTKITMGGSGNQVAWKGDLLISSGQPGIGSAASPIGKLFGTTASLTAGEFTAYASASAYKGSAFPSSSCNGSQFVQWITSGLFTCATPSTAGSSPFPNGLSARVTTSSAFTHITSISFEGNSFTFGNTASAATVRINWGSNGVASRSAANTWSAANTFTLGASVSPGFEVAGYASISGTFLLPMRSNTASGGFQFYNTAQMANNYGGNGNYENARMYWTGNVFTIDTAKGGTGAQRAITMNVGAGNTITLRTTNTQYVVSETAGTSGFYQFQRATGTANGVGTVFSGTWNASTGLNPIVQISSTINQSSTAGYKGYFENLSVTAHGSGLQDLMNLQGNSSDRFTVDINGLTTLTASSSATNSLVDLTQPAANASVSLRLLGNNSNTQNAWSLVGGGLSGIDYDRFQIQNNGIPLFEIASNSHVISRQATKPTITCTAGSPTVTAGSTDNAGQFVAGATATSCTVTFTTPWGGAPACTAAVDGLTGLAIGVQTSTTTVVFAATGIGGDTVSYLCQGFGY